MLAKTIRSVSMVVHAPLMDHLMDFRAPAKMDFPEDFVM